MLKSWPDIFRMLLLAATSYTDLRWRRIPNWATYTALAWALATEAAAASSANAMTLILDISTPPARGQYVMKRR